MHSKQTRIMLLCTVTPMLLNLTILTTFGQQVQSKTPQKIEKRIKWDITDQNGNAAQGNAVFEHALHVFAKDKHGGGPKDDPPSPASVEGDFPALHYEQGNNKERRLGWTKTQNDTQPIGSAKTFDTYFVEKSSEHPYAKSSINAIMMLPNQVTDPKTNKTRYFLETHIFADVTATTTTPPKSHAPETSTAEAFAAGKITIDCGTVVSLGGTLPFGFKKGSTGRLITNGPKFEERIAKGGGSSNSAGRKDPISLGFYDAESGSLIAEQDLWQEQWDVDFNGMVESNETGLTLSTGISGDPTGSASIELDTLGSWVQNPFNGTASLIDGVFTATGNLAGLPWQITTVDDVTTSFLAAADLNPEFEFEILATGLGDQPMNMRLVSDEEDYAFAEASVVPEPGTLALLAMGWLGLARLRKPELS